MKTVDFSETIEACDLKVGRYRQLIEVMKVRLESSPTFSFFFLLFLLFWLVPTFF